MKRKNFLRVMAVVLATTQLFALAGCSSKKSDSGSDSTDGDVVELRFMDIQGSDERTEYFEWVVEEFEKENPNIKVTFESVPWDNGYNKLVTLGSAGDLPDIFINNLTYVAEFEEAGWLYDLDEYLQEGFEDNFTDFAQKEMIDKELRQLYGSVGVLPVAAAPVNFMIRTDWLEEAGMTMDDIKTWDGLFEAMEKMTDSSQNHYGYSFRGGQGGANQLHFYVWAAAHGLAYEEDGRSVYYRDEVKDAVKEFVSIYENGYGPQDSVNWGFVETVQGFSSGLTGLLCNNADVMASFGDLDEDCWTSILFPESDDGKIYAPCGSHPISIAKTSEHPDEAWKFLEFLMSDEINAEFCKRFYMIPLTKSLSENPEFSEGKLAGFVETINAPNYVRTVEQYGYFPEATEFQTTVFDAEFQSLLLGQQTVDEFCTNVADWLTEKQQAYMKENPDVALPNCDVE